MIFEEFILQQIIERRVEFNKYTSKFYHPFIVLSDNDIKRVVINEKGYSLGLTDHTIQNKVYNVICKLGNLLYRNYKVCFNLNVSESLAIGEIFDLEFILVDRNVNCRVQLMRVGNNRFMALNSNYEYFIPFEFYEFLDSVIQPNKSYCCIHKTRSLNFKIININRVVESPVERALNISLQDEYTNKKTIKHNCNPTALFLHEYLTVTPQLSLEDITLDNLKKITDISDFIQYIREYISGCNVSDDVILQYPIWLKFCQLNGLSAMMIDELINLFWAYR